MKKIWLIIMVVAFLCFSLLIAVGLLAPQELELTSEDYQYTVKNGEVTITQYTGDAEEVTIPDEIGGDPVVTIARNAFKDCKSMISVTLPDSVVCIEDYAFYRCDSLERVHLGRGIRDISDTSFKACSIDIYREYEKGRYLGNDENPYLVLISIPYTNMETYSKKIETVSIHPDTEVIASFAIEDCELLREVVFPDRVVVINDMALYGCEAIERVYIPASVESIGKLVFHHCDSIMEISVSDENAYYQSLDGSLMTRDGTHLLKYACGRQDAYFSVPEGTVKIENSAFENAVYLQEVVIPDSVEEIDSFAFSSCESIRQLHLGNGLRTIGGSAFASCSSLTEIAIPDSVQELDHSAFSSCDALKTVVLGNGLEYVGAGAFSGCDALQEVVFRDPDGWEVSAAKSFTSYEVDVSDSAQNVDYLTDEYREYYWNKDS